MKVQRRALLAALGTLARAVHPRAGIPSLMGVRIDVAGGFAMLTRSDLDVTARLPLLVEPDSGAETWTALPTARAVSDLLKVMRADVVEIHPDGKRLKIGPALLECWSIEDFPAVEFPEPTLVFDAQEAREVFTTLNAFAADEEARPTLTGVGFEVHGRRLTLAASDSYRAAMQEFDLADEMNDAAGIVPARFLRFVAEQIGTLTGQVEIGFEGQTAVAIFPDGRAFAAKTIEGVMPDLRKLIRGALKKCSGQLWFGDQAAAEEVCRVALAVLPEHQPMVFRLAEAAGLNAQGPRWDKETTYGGTFSMQVEGATWAGEPTRTAYNPGYWLTALRAAPGATIHMPTGAAQLQPAIFRKRGLTVAVMPVRLPEPIESKGAAA